MSVLNRHRYKLLCGSFWLAPPPPDYRTGWPHMDAVIGAKCGRCQSDPGFYCQSRTGAKVWPPHSSRFGLVD